MGAARSRLVQRLKDAESLKPAIMAAKKEWHSARESARTVDQSMRKSESEIRRLQSRLSELQSGRGRRLARLGFGQATVYEFWLELPGYSGPVAGAFAELGLEGSLSHVSNISGHTKGGLGTAVAGGLLFGPAGAVSGAIIGRKTTVNTKVEEVDTRQYELRVTGPGYAWSTTGDSLAQNSFRRFRDIVNARSSTPESINILIQDTEKQIEQATISVSSIRSSSSSANQKAEEIAIKYNKLLGEYQRERLPLRDDISIRFDQLGLGGKLIFLIVGPLPTIMIPYISKAMIDQGIANTSLALYGYLGLAGFWFLILVFYIKYIRLGW